jgi:hypothetical protein
MGPLTRFSLGIVLFTLASCSAAPSGSLGSSAASTAAASAAPTMYGPIANSDSVLLAHGFTENPKGCVITSGVEEECRRFANQTLTINLFLSGELDASLGSVPLQGDVVKLTGVLAGLYAPDVVAGAGSALNEAIGSCSGRGVGGPVSVGQYTIDAGCTGPFASLWIRRSA